MSLLHLVPKRVAAVNGSGIRQVFDRAAKLRREGKALINMGIGQPDFAVPPAVKAAACRAIVDDHNGYAESAGVDALRGAIIEHLGAELGWRPPVAGPVPEGVPGLMVSSGTSGALWLAISAVTEAGDEVIIPDPYFVLYPQAVRLAGGTPVFCDTYPDFAMTAARVERLITARTKAVVVASPGNPSGVVMSQGDLDALAALCAKHNILLISDEIYDTFTYADAIRACGGRYATPARAPVGGLTHTLIVRGFGKTYGITGWRLGYAAGPREIVEQMTKLQQYSFVCAPTPLQHAAAAAMKTDMTATIQRYSDRREIVLETLGPVCGQIVRPGGAFYVFAPIPARVGISGAELVNRAMERGVVVINGGVFSQRDTHFRVSYTVPEAQLRAGCQVVADILK
jgi:aspartate/methionine/tyrosine aminotransferase